MLNNINQEQDVVVGYQEAMLRELQSQIAKCRSMELSALQSRVMNLAKISRTQVKLKFTKTGDALHTESTLAILNNIRYDLIRLMDQMLSDCGYTGVMITPYSWLEVFRLVGRADIPWVVAQGYRINETVALAIAVISQNLWHYDQRYHAIMNFVNVNCDMKHMLIKEVL